MWDVRGLPFKLIISLAFLFPDIAEFFRFSCFITGQILGAYLLKHRSAPAEVFNEPSRKMQLEACFSNSSRILQAYNMFWVRFEYPWVGWLKIRLSLPKISEILVLWLFAGWGFLFIFFGLPFWLISNCIVFRSAGGRRPIANDGKLVVVSQNECRVSQEFIVFFSAAIRLSPKKCYRVISSLQSSGW